MRAALILASLSIVLLVACTTKKQPPVATHSSLADSADQVIYNLRFRLTDNGVWRAQLEADTAYGFDENTRIELEKVHTTFFTTSGAKDAVLTSQRGTYNSRSNNMIARKNVVVVSEDGRRLTTSELIYNQQRNQISSDSAFVLTEPNRRVEGIGFRSDPNMQNIQILKNATGVVRALSTEAAPSQGTTQQTVPPQTVPSPTTPQPQIAPQAAPVTRTPAASSTVPASRRRRQP
ncbi:MAG: LPS export ABC transporter periplasmic protein LptC [Gemmatimonadaceae bacterium]